MVVHPDCPGLEASVVVNDDVLKEYDDRTQVPAKTVERYVEAQTGAEFEVHFRFSHPFPTDRAVSMIVTVDGKDVDEPLVRSRDLCRKVHASQGSISNVGSEHYVQKFRFAELDIGEYSLILQIEQ